MMINKSSQCGSVSVTGIHLQSASKMVSLPFVGVLESLFVSRTGYGPNIQSLCQSVFGKNQHYPENHHLEYVYDPKLVLEGIVKRPDFKVVDDDTGEVWYWEHCGMMDDPRYKKRWEDKKAFYQKNGIAEGKNLIVTYDENGVLDSQVVERIIQETLDQL